MTSLEELAQCKQVDQRYFWYLVNKKVKRPGNSARLQPTRNEDGAMKYDIDDINRSWQKYYTDLHMPNDQPQYDAEHELHVVNETLRSLPEHSFSDDAPLRTFTITEVERTCKKLKCRKAA